MDILYSDASVKQRFQSVGSTLIAMGPGIEQPIQPLRYAGERLNLNKKLCIPEWCVVLLVGPSSAGKSTFAKQHFSSTEVLSSDHFRALVSDDENDQSATQDAFDLLYLVAQKRLLRKKLCLIDATNLRPVRPAGLRGSGARIRLCVRRHRSESAARSTSGTN